MNLRLIKFCFLNSNFMSASITIILLYSISWLHHWEKHDIFNVILISHKHCNSINTSTPTTCWWETEFKSINVIHINVLCFKITCIFCCSLTLECFKLSFWIVQLSICIYNFIVVNKELKSFR